MFAFAADKADHTSAAFEDADESSGELFFGERFGLFFFIAGVQNDVAKRLHAFEAGDIRLLVRIDIIHFEVRRQIGVAIKRIAGPVIGIGLVEEVDVDGGFEAADNFFGLVGEGVAFVGGGIDGLVVGLRQPVDRADNGQNHNHINDQIDAVAGLPCLHVCHYALHRSDSREREVRNRPRKMAER